MEEPSGNGNWVSEIATLSTDFAPVPLDELVLEPLRRASPAPGSISVRIEAKRKSQLACFSFLM